MKKYFSFVTVSMMVVMVLSMFTGAAQHAVAEDVVELTY